MGCEVKNYGKKSPRSEQSCLVYLASFFLFPIPYSTSHVVVVSTIVYSGGSPQGVILPTKEHLTMSGNIFDCHN